MFGQIGERNSAIVADFEEHEAARDHRNPTMTDIPPFRLGGEIDPNDWNFSRLGEAGPLPNPIGHTFPPLTTLISRLQSIVGPGGLIHSASELLVYECDGYTIEKNRPDVVVFPTSADQVVAISTFAVPRTSSRSSPRQVLRSPLTVSAVAARCR